MISFRHAAPIGVFVVITLGCGDLKEEGIADVDLVPSNVQDVFDNRCAISGCHVGGHSTGLDLREANAYATTVDVASSERPLLKRVDPGQASVSYLYQKISGTPGIDGSRMPLTGGNLTSEQIDLIGTWIDQGARNRQEQPNVYVVQTFSFAQHIAPIFQHHCGGCHDGSGGTLPASMNLASDPYASIVLVPSQEAPSYPRVKPFYPDSSYLYHKVVPTSSVRTGERMPAGGPYLGSAAIDTLHTWITEGAVNN